MTERLAIISKVRWDREEVGKIEKEEGFKIIEFKFEGKIEENYRYKALVEWDRY